MKPLQSHSKLTEIQSRLNKQSYLSRSNLPGSADARMFIHLQSIKRYPDRKLYPNFYHWYILMKQFSLSSIQKWISSNQTIQDDHLITQLTSIKITQQRQSILEPQTKKPQTQPPSLSQQHLKLAKSQQYTIVHSSEIQYVMDVKLKQQDQCNVKQLLKKFLCMEELDGLDLQQFLQEKRVRIVAKMEREKFQQLKNKISALEGVETFESKKKDKRFKTVNSGEL